MTDTKTTLKSTAEPFVPQASQQTMSSSHGQHGQSKTIEVGEPTGEESVTMPSGSNDSYTQAMNGMASMGLGQKHMQAQVAQMQQQPGGYYQQNMQRTHQPQQQSVAYSPYNAMANTGYASHAQGGYKMQSQMHGYGSGAGSGYGHATGSYARGQNSNAYRQQNHFSTGQAAYTGGQYYNDYATPPANFGNHQLATDRVRTQDMSMHHYGEPNVMDTSYLTLSDRQGMYYDPNINSQQLQEVEQYLFGAGYHMQPGIDFEKYDDIPVEVSGDNIPPATDSFEHCGFCPLLMDNIRRAKYSKPTPIQKYAIPIGIAERDIMACAQTGSGKTAAFLFPMINYIIEAKSHSSSGLNQNYRKPNNTGGVACPTGLVLAPTRELVNQIFTEAVRFTHRSGVHCVVVYGGSDISKQINQLSKYETSIIVAAPGRLVDLTEKGHVKFCNIKFLVLDEADRMLDMGFSPQIRQIVEGFDMPTKESRQTSMFSATFPHDIQQLAADFMKNYLFVTVGRVGGTTSSITQRVELVEDYAKREALVIQLNSVHGLTLVFVETKRSANDLHRQLFQYGVSVTSIHGDRSQRDRERALSEFSTGKCTVMIATDVASRGLDIPNVAHVINFDMPNDIESYIHRIGRTGRAGNKGLATSFINEKSSKLARDLIHTLEDTEQVVPEFLYTFQMSSGHGGKGGKPRRGRGGHFGGRDFRNTLPGGFAAPQQNFAPYNRGYAFSGNQRMNYTSSGPTVPGFNQNQW